MDAEQAAMSASLSSFVKNRNQRSGWRSCISFVCLSRLLPVAWCAQQTALRGGRTFVDGAVLGAHLAAVSIMHGKLDHASPER